MTDYWKAKAAPIIAAILAQSPDPATRRRLLRAAYPFGPRTNWPYTAWLKEIKAQWPGFTRRPPEPDELQLRP